MPSVALTHELSFTSTTVGQQLVFPLSLRGNGPGITADWLQRAAVSLDPPGKHPAASVRPLSQAEPPFTKVPTPTTAVCSGFLVPGYDARIFNINPVLSSDTPPPLAAPPACSHTGDVIPSWKLQLIDSFQEHN